jgi:ribosomal protein L7/L12
MMPESGIDWFSFALGFIAAIALFAVIRRRKHRVDLDAPPALPVDLPGELKAVVLKYRAEGRTIEAIKLVRERTGCDLKSAKDYVDRLR